ncbi:MAG TPA: hypothetical protein VEV82_01215 [Actinomycetota bacterium]|nr:hypothetical protein [Actinomycetota bacterium]
MRDKIKGALGDIETAEKHYTDFTRLYLEEKAPRSVSTGFQKMFGAAGAFALGFERAISAVRTDVGLDRLKVSHIAVDFPSWAKGTGDFKEGGLARVGERGEEIVYLPPHSAVIPAHKSREIPSEIRDRIPGYAKGAGDFGSLLSLLYPANDPAHPNHLHYESDSNASAIALAKAIEALKIIPRFIVSELEGFHNRGQISTGHMVGSAHYDGRAGDVNNRAGTSAAEQKDLGNLADWIRNVTSGGTSAFGGGLAALNPRAIVTDALRSVDVPVFPGKLRPVGPSAARQLSKGLFGRAQEWIGDMGMNSALSGSRDVTAAIELGKQMAARKGWVGPEWSALHTLWDYESGWRWWADNPLSSAYGIPQALPGSKMAAAGPDWRTNPATQIDWGLDYIKVRPDYGTPSRALAMWQSRSPHWYHDGGLIPEPVVGFGQRSGDRYHFAKDELVTPGSKVSGGRGIRDVTIHLTINGPTAGDPKKLARFLRGEIIDVLEESEQMNR